MVMTLPCLVPVGALLGWVAGGAAAMPAFASALLVLALPFMLLFALVYMLLLYWSRARGEPGVRGRLRRVGELAKLTLQPSYPLRRLLELRMGACRDYAKLTAALLANLYPGGEVYLLSFPLHVAAAVGLGGRVYVLDQKLPVLEPEAWLARWGRKKARVYRLTWSGNGAELSYAGRVARRGELGALDLKALTRALAGEVEEALREGRGSATVTLRGAAGLLDVEDAVVGESLRRMVELTLGAEFPGRLRVEGVELSRRGDDVAIAVKLSPQGSRGAPAPSHG